MDPAIHTEGLTKRFGTLTAVDSLDLDVQPGELFGFLGPNGAGKTTTIAMLLGLVTPTAGRALLFGHDIRHHPLQALQQVGALIETPAFYPYLSGRDNLRVLARASALPETRIDGVLERVGLADRGRDRFKQYSLGMRQRLGIAAALLSEPRLLILDEPTNGLDPAGQQEIRTLLRTLTEQGQTVFLSSHTLSDVEQLCERVAILNHGRLIAQGHVSTLLQQGERLIVRVAGDPQRAAAVLHTLAWIGTIEPHDGALIVAAPLDRAADISMALAAAALPVTEIRPHTGRLEDFFLDITRT